MLGALGFFGKSSTKRTFITVFSFIFRSASETNGSQLSLSNSEKSLSSSRTSLTNHSQKSINNQNVQNIEPSESIPNVDVIKESENENGNVNDNAIINNANDKPNCNERDMTCAVVDHRGAILVNQYWGVSLEIPENALPEGIQQEIYFVISDPRLCENAPPLDFENGIWLLTIFFSI